jgi:hypothetical protein
MTEPTESPNVRLARAIGEAVGITSMKHCAGLRLELTPGQLPKVVAEFWLQSPEGLVKALAEYEMTRRAEPIGAEGAPEVSAMATEAIDAG